MRLILRPEAKADIADAADWYESHAGRGNDFVATVYAALESIERLPTRFPRPQTYDGPRDIRRMLLRRYPYAIIFELTADRVRVAAVVHTHRHPGAWLTRVK